MLPFSPQHSEAGTVITEKTESPRVAGTKSFNRNVDKPRTTPSLPSSNAPNGMPGVAPNLSGKEGNSERHSATSVKTGRDKIHLEGRDRAVRRISHQVSCPTQKKGKLGLGANHSVEAGAWGSRGQGPR